MKLFFLVFFSLFGIAGDAMEYHHDGSQQIFLSRDGSTLLSQSYKRPRYRGWNLKDGKPLDLSRLSSDTHLNIVALAPDGKALLQENSDPSRVLEIWHWNKTKMVLSSTLRSRRGEWLLSSTFQGNNCILLWQSCIETWNLAGKLKRRVCLDTQLGLEGGECSASLSNDGHRILAFVKGRWAIFNSWSGHRHHLLQRDLKYDLPSDTYYAALGFSPDGRFVLGRHEYIQSDGYDFENDQPFVSMGESIWEVKTGALLWPNCGWHSKFLSRDRILSGNGIYDIHTRGNVGHIISSWNTQNENWVIESNQISADGRVWAELNAKGNIVIGCH